MKLTFGLRAIRLCSFWLLVALLVLPVVSAEAALVICGPRPSTIIASNSPRYLASCAIGFLAILTVISYCVLLARRPTKVIKRKYQLILLSLFVISSMLIAGVASVYPAIKSHLAFQRMIASAQEGNEVAQRYVGEKYAQDDHREAYFWFSLVANGWGQDIKRRDEVAQYLTPEETEVVTKRISSWSPRQIDRDVEVQSWIADAESGDVVKQRRLGNYYKVRQSLGGIPQYQEAAKWYLKAAAQNDMTAQHNLAAMYSKGLGVQKNIVESVYWQLRAGRGLFLWPEKKLTRSLTAEQIVEISKRLGEGNSWLDGALSLAYSCNLKLPDKLTVQKLCKICPEACVDKKEAE